MANAEDRKDVNLYAISHAYATKETRNIYCLNKDTDAEKQG